MYRRHVRIAHLTLAPMLAIVLCRLAISPVQAEEGIFWEAIAPNRPVLILMPTIHALPDAADDISATLDQALMRANSVVTESPLGGATPKVQEIAVQRMEVYPPSDNLENYVGMQDIDALHTCADNAHFRYDVFIRLKPWALSLLVMHRVRGPAEFDGIDERVASGAQATHKNYTTLVNVVENMAILADIPQRLQAAELIDTCRKFAKPIGNEFVRVLEDDWRRGDAAALARDIERPLQPDDPPELTEVSDAMAAHGTELFFGMLMGERIQALKGPILVALGSAHLVGPSSMIPRLEKAGYTVQRVDLVKFPAIPVSSGDRSGASEDRNH